ncbi:MAG: hypothetical protein JXA89_19785 [Anaerolineae bacterium]|nr:hypothetical protein [Anaerolineae bacterium]
MTITHPGHPLHGQQVQVVHLHRSAKLEIVIRSPDGHHTRIPASWTDYPLSPATSQATPSARDLADNPTHLLDLDGLRQAVHLIDRIRHGDTSPSSGDDRAGKGDYNEPH